MTAATRDVSPARRKAVAPRARLSCDDSGHWTLSGLDSPARQFPDFDAAIASARHVPGANTATIEVWQGGEYICCLPSEGPSSRGVAHDAAPIDAEGRAATSAERYANRVAQALMATAGLLFWLALMVVALAASLGWRLFLL
jgi:hypothetical protein